jgi:DNA-binding MarR family transcriptional regulator
MHIQIKMANKRHTLPTTPCLCNALRQATRAVSRLYDDELRSVGLRTTQFSLLRRLRRAGEVRQRDLGSLTFLDETTLTRNLRPLIAVGWVDVRPGKDRREKFIRLTEAGRAKLKEAQPAWEQAQERLRSRMPRRTWTSLLERLLPELTRLADTV